MPTHKLNDSFIKHYPQEENEIQLHDTLVKGLTVRIYKSGYKSFVYRYKYNGKSKAYTIGKFGTVSLADARDLGRELHLKILNGIDPSESSEGVTFRELWEPYRKKHLPNLRESTSKEYIRVFEVELKSLHKTELTQLTKSAIRKILDRKAITESSPTQANRIKAILSSILSFGVERDYLKNNIVLSISNYETGSTGRDRFYTTEEINTLWEEFENMPEPTSSAYKMLLLTGQRKTETLKTKWEYINWKNRVWTIPEHIAKNGKKHEVPLSDGVVKLLKKLKDGYAKGSDYLFPSPSPRITKDQPIQSLKNQKENVQDNSISDFRTHDIRRTVATHCAKLGVQEQTIGRLLNHSQAGRSNTITAIYNRHNYLEEKRTALQDWYERLVAMVQDG